MSIADKLLYLNQTKRLIRESLNPVLAERGQALLTEGDPFREYAARLHPILSLFQSGEQGVWYDPSDLSTLFQNSAGTVPVTASGDPVGLMLDKSGRGNHATQGLSARRPTYQTDGAKSWLAFDGVDDFLNTGKNVIGGLAYWWGASYEASDAGGVGAIFASADDSHFSHALYSDTRVTPKRVCRAFSDMYVDRLSTLLPVAPEVVSAMVDNLQLSGWVNGELQGSVVTNGAGNVSNFRIGSYFTIRTRFNFYSGIALDRPVTESERLFAEQWLAQKAGVTL